MKTKVFVGMSGGVDSSLTAALLLEQGYDVTGVYMKNWTQDLPGMQCPWADDLADAKRVAVQLGIPFKVYDFQDQYRHKVVDYMIAEYQAGRTPNPDIMCNQEVKFKLFLETALADGADMIATGHYARVGEAASSAVSPSVAVGSRHRPVEKLSLASAELGAEQLLKQSSPHQENFSTVGGLTEAPASNASEEAGHLFKAVDESKDQTYFLYRVTNEALAKTLFPLGNYKKTQVRKIAQEKDLVTAAKRDSQGICFVGSVGIQEFLSQFVTSQPGSIIDKETGSVVGQHLGAIFYTLGQRHGLSVGGGLPYYVVDKDMEKNEVYVSRNLNDENMWRKELTLSDLHWINNPPKINERVEVRLRHRGALKPAILDGETLQLKEPERAVAGGQSAVIYRGDEVLGGGIVK